jgi:hypothetical protein
VASSAHSHEGAARARLNGVLAKCGRRAMKHLPAAKKVRTCVGCFFFQNLPPLAGGGDRGGSSANVMALVALAAGCTGPGRWTEWRGGGKTKSTDLAIYLLNPRPT